MTWQPARFVGRNAVADVVAHLRANDVKAAQSLVGWNGHPVVQVTRTGGRLSGVLERVDLQFNCKASDVDDAEDICQAARTVLSQAQLHIAGCVVAREIVGPFWLPDGDTLTTPQYVMDWALTFRTK